MDQLRGYWFDSLTDSQSVPRLMITCISITSLTGYTVWFVSAALYIVSSTAEIILSTWWFNKALFFHFAEHTYKTQVHLRQWQKKTFPKFFKGYMQFTFQKTVSKGHRDNTWFLKFKIWEDNPDNIGTDDWLSLVLLLKVHITCQLIFKMLWVTWQKITSQILN